MKKSIILVIVAMIIVGLMWFFSEKENTKNVLDSSKPIKIGAALALTGFGASWAENSLNGIKLAVKEINGSGGVLGRNLELVVEDTKTEPKYAVLAANKLISVDGVPFLVAGWTNEIEAIAPIVDQNRIVTMTVSAGASGITKRSRYLFRTWPADQIAVRALINYAKEKSISSFGVAHSIGSWEDTLIESFKSLATENNIQVSEPVSFQIDTQDFKTIISKLKGSGVGGAFIPITSGPFERFVRQAGELGFAGTLLYPVDVVGIGLPDKVAASYLKNIVYASYAAPKNNFVDSYQKEYGIYPGVSADTAYDAVHMLTKAIEKAGSIDPDKVAASFSVHDGASGRIEFDENRDRSNAEVILMTFDGKTNIPVRVNN